MRSMWIDGASVASKETFAVENPATEEVIEEVPRARAEDVDLAVAAASAAFEDWWHLPGLDKAERLHAVAAKLREKQEPLAHMLTLEGGKPLLENRDEVEWCAACFDYYAELGRHDLGRVIAPVREHQFNFVVKEPYGVVAAIVPWNYPLLLLCWKLAPALAAGNTTVVKPSELTPLATLMLRDVFDVLPRGAVNIVTGYGSEAGEALVNHPDISVVAFTGSVATGRKIAVKAAEQLKKVHLELGGNDPFIVCDDVDIDVAARGAAFATNVSHDMELFREETFGPVAPVLRVRDIDEAARLANDSKYGLGASIYTNNLEHAMTAATRIRAGTFWINDPLTDNEAGPFGGMRFSGMGRELGAEGLEGFRDTKHIHLDYKVRAMPDWYPYKW